MPRASFSEQDLKNPDRLRVKLNDAYEQIYALIDRMQQLESATGVVTQVPVPASPGRTAVIAPVVVPQGDNLTAQERTMLRALLTGSTENAATGQKPVLPTVSALPPVPSATPGDMVVLSTDGIVYRFDGTTRTWIPIGSSSPANMVTTNTPQTIGPGAAKVFADSVNVTVNQNAATAVAITNTTSGTLSQVLTFLQTALGSFSRIVHDAARVATHCGIVLGGWAELTVSAALNGLLINTLGATPIVFGTANIERGRFDQNGSFIITGPNGSSFLFGWNSELVTLSTVGATTDTAAALIPGFGVILAATTFVKVGITGAGVTSVQVGDANTPSLTRFFSITSLSIGSGAAGMDQWKGSVATDAAGPLMYPSSKVRFTAVGGTPTAGQVRVVVFYAQVISPTS